ncbi:MAG: hypothetical protein ISR69_15095 [Gammaproteobacteria bacterium]|nr:hypothetical protein [Gammaproteobacteria bacterium]
MKHFLFIVLTVSCLVFTNTVAAHHGPAHGERNYGALTEADFTGPKPAGSPHDAETASGVAEQYRYGVNPDGTIDIGSASYETFMDTSSSWFDSTLPEADKKSF